MVKAPRKVLKVFQFGAYIALCIYFATFFSTTTNQFNPNYIYALVTISFLLDHLVPLSSLNMRNLFPHLGVEN